MSEAVVERLEAVAARLESVARKLGGGGGGDEDEVPMYVTDYEAIINKEVKALADGCNSIELPGASEPLLQAFQCSLGFLRRVPKSKKPTGPEIEKVLEEATASYKKLNDKAEPRGKAARKSDRDLEMIYTAIREAANSATWVKYAAPGMTPKQFVVDMCQSTAQSKITQLVLKCKDDKKKQKAKDINKPLKELFEKLTAFVKEYFKTGIDYNPKGKSILEVAGGGAASSGGGGDNGDNKEDEQKESGGSTKKKKGGGVGDRNALFAALNKGGGVTKGLNKVKDSQKTKNRDPKDKRSVVKAAPKKSGKKRKKFGPPTTKFLGGRWIVENYDEHPDVITVEKANLKSNVFISMCDQSTINVTNKVKAVTIDNCVKVRVYVNEVVSTVEIVNCKSVKVYVVPGGKVPSFAVDKCESPQIILSKSAFEQNPDIYSSNVSAMNVEVPGKTENDDNKEFPIPEQFLTKIDPKTGECTTTPTEH